MDKKDIELGKHYAIRERVGDDLQRVKILESVRSGKWKAEWIDPNPGLVDYVASRHVMVPWGQRQAFLRDERNEAQLTAAIGRLGFPGDQHPLGLAVETVLESTSEKAVSVYRGALHFDREALDRIAVRAGVGPSEHPAGYRDRHGREHLPWCCALDLAEAFARNEPATVLDVPGRQVGDSRPIGG